METVSHKHHIRDVAIHSIELVLAVAVAVGMFAYAVHSAVFLYGMDWSSSITFEELIQRILFLLVGVELIQIVWAHRLRDVFLVSVFLLARKAFDPSNTTGELIILALAVAFIIGAWHFVAKKAGISLDEPL